ncbi:MAG: YggS family pyridoxal phosphate-dependent enzyme [Candidatus Berkiella sp.]
MTDVATNLQVLLNRIRTLEQTYHRAPNSVSLLAVSKSQSASLIETLACAGQQDFGENYLQEALIKISALSHQQLSWHFIGPIQSKKAPLIAQYFSWVHTVCRLKEAQLLSKQRSHELGPLNICIQVKLDADPNRSGIAISEVPSLIQAIKDLPQLKLRGLMTIAPISNDFKQQCFYYDQLKSLMDSLNDKNALDTLSMGMSDSIEAAIAKGATIVRVGTALFGPRIDK